MDHLGQVEVLMKVKLGERQKVFQGPLQRQACWQEEQALSLESVSSVSGSAETNNRIFGVFVRNCDIRII